MATATETAAASGVTEFSEIIIEVTAAPYPSIEAGLVNPPHALQPLNDLVHNKDAGFLTRTFSTKGWTRKTTVHAARAGTKEIVTFRGRRIPLEALNDLLLRLNQCHASTLRIDFTPELPHMPQRLFETLYVPGLRELHFEQPLPSEAVPALAEFVRGDPGRDLQIIRINRLRLTEETVQTLVQGLIAAQVPYIGYKFAKDGPGLEIDLGVHKRPRARRGSSGSVIVVPRY